MTKDGGREGERVLDDSGEVLLEPSLDHKVAKSDRSVGQKIFQTLIALEFGFIGEKEGNGLFVVLYSIAAVLVGELGEALKDLSDHEAHLRIFPNQHLRIGFF